MLPGMDEMVDPKFYYAKRHKEEYTLQGDGISHTTTFLLGVTDESNTLFIEVSPDGESWRWKLHR